MPLPSETAVAFSKKLNRAERSEAVGPSGQRERERERERFEAFCETLTDSSPGALLARPLAQSDYR